MISSCNVTTDEGEWGDLVVGGGGPHKERFAGTCGTEKAVGFGRFMGNPVPINGDTDVGTFSASFRVLILRSPIVMSVVALVMN